MDINQTDELEIRWINVFRVRTWVVAGVWGAIPYFGLAALGMPMFLIWIIAWVAATLSFVAMLMMPLECSHCGKAVKTGYYNCHHCGRNA